MTDFSEVVEEEGTLAAAWLGHVAAHKQASLADAERSRHEIGSEVCFLGVKHLVEGALVGPGVAGLGCAH